MKKNLLLFALWCSVLSIQAQSVPKPLFDDPVFHGAADPVVVYNHQKNKWWMFYTNRRASLADSTVQWVHGTRIGIAESTDGRHWQYLDTAVINYRPDSGYTFWAPEIIRQGNLYHMYLTYVPGIFKDWNHPRVIVQLTSNDLLHWNYQSVLNLVNKKVIDAAVYPVRKGLWRLWYNNEADGKSIYYAESNDLYHWVDKGKAVDTRGEGPKVFKWKGRYFMIVDVWNGMAVFSSTDLLHWKMQPNRILETPGKGKDDQAIGGHCDVLVNGGHAYIFYFTHPGRRKENPATESSFENKRSVIQLAELTFEKGIITCDRNLTPEISLKP